MVLYGDFEYCKFLSKYDQYTAHNGCFCEINACFIFYLILACNIALCWDVLWRNPMYGPCFSDKFHAWMELLLDALSLISASRDKNDCNIRNWLLAYVLAMYVCMQPKWYVDMLLNTVQQYKRIYWQWGRVGWMLADHRGGLSSSFFSLILDSSVCKQTISLLAIWCLRPWARILHSAEENNLSPFDSNIACLCHARASKLPATSIYIVAIVLLQLSPLCIILVGKFGEPLRDQ